MHWAQFLLTCKSLGALLQKFFHSWWAWKIHTKPSCCPIKIFQTVLGFPNKWQKGGRKRKNFSLTQAFASSLFGTWKFFADPGLGTIWDCVLPMDQAPQPFLASVVPIPAESCQKSVPKTVQFWVVICACATGKGHSDILNGKLEMPKVRCDPDIGDKLECNNGENKVFMQRTKAVNVHNSLLLSMTRVWVQQSRISCWTMNRTRHTQMGAMGFVSQPHYEATSDSSTVWCNTCRQQVFAWCVVSHNFDFAWIGWALRLCFPTWLLAVMDKGLITPIPFQFQTFSLSD